jgi:hypothetical protein
VASGVFAGRHVGNLVLATLLTLAAGAWSGASAAGATGTVAIGTVTVSTSFENSPISLQTSDAVGYALTNTTGVTQTVTFTDNLPAGVTLDDPIGTTDTEGSGACTLTPPAAEPGNASVTVTVAVPSAAGTVCTIAFGVVASTPSNDQAEPDSYSHVSTSSGLIPVTTSGTLTVLNSPALSFSAPVNGQSFYLGQIATATFACAATDPLDSIDSFFATDDEGNQIESGAPIDTIDPGTRTLEVECYSAAGGGEVSRSLSYSVGSYTVNAVRAVPRTGHVSFRTLVPPGRIVAELIYGKRVIGTTIATVASRSSTRVTVRPKPAGRRLLAAARGRSVAVTLQVSFKPQAIGAGDEQITPGGATVVTRNLRLPLPRRHNGRLHKALADRADSAPVTH